MKRLIRSAAVIPLLLFAAEATGQSPRILFFEDFESGGQAWAIEDDTWEIGQATAGPRAAHSGAHVAATILGGRSPGNADARLVSPLVELPSVVGRSERIQVRFWHWSYSNDKETGTIEVSTEDDPQWRPLTDSVISDSRFWTQHIVDLTPFAGSNIRIALRFTASSGLFPGLGWYVDDVSVEVSSRALSLFEDFESGIGDWYADRGVWEVGPPTTGLTPISGQNVAGTVLSNRNPGNASSRLISPPIRLRPVASDARIELKFSHWSYSGSSEEGVVEIIEEGGTCGSVHTISNSMTTLEREWVEDTLDLTDFQDSSIRVAFRFTAYSGLFPGLGWYIDWVEISVTDSPRDQPLPVRSRSRTLLTRER